MNKLSTSRRTQSGHDAGDESGFTLIELLVSILILSVIMTGMFMFLWGASSHWQTGQATADVNENARLGLNRMTREMRQGTQVTEAQTGEVAFSVDFGAGDGAETVTYSFEAGGGGAPGRVWRSTSTSSGSVTLIDDVESVEFSYYGNDYRCDGDTDGEVTYVELQACSQAPLTEIARVDIELTMRAGGGAPQIFLGQAWLRNRTI